MKTLIYRTFLVIFVGLFLSKGADGQGAPPSPITSNNFTGHAQKDQEAVKLATDTIVGKFVSIGYAGSDADGEDFYEQAKIEVVSALRGTIQGEVSVTYSVHSMPGKDRENPPSVGVNYLMFIHKTGESGFRIKKILPATDENIAKVKALIAASPAGK